VKTTNRQTQEEKPLSVDSYARLVALPIHSENIFHFPDGLPAFESLKEFVFLCKPDTRPFFFMQALNPPDISFVCIDPFLVYPDYTPKVSDADARFLNLTSMEDALIISIVTVSKNVEDITVNLQGPVVVNIRSSVGRQVICESQNYPVRYRMWDALNRIETRKKALQPDLSAGDGIVYAEMQTDANIIRQ